MARTKLAYAPKTRPGPAGPCTMRTRASSSRHRAPMPPSTPLRDASDRWADGASDLTSGTVCLPATNTRNMRSQAATPEP